MKWVFCLVCLLLLVARVQAAGPTGQLALVCSGFTVKTGAQGNTDHDFYKGATGSNLYILTEDSAGVWSGGGWFNIEHNDLGSAVYGYVTFSVVDVTGQAGVSGGWWKIVVSWPGASAHGTVSGDKTVYLAKTAGAWNTTADLVTVATTWENATGIDMTYTTNKQFLTSGGSYSLADVGYFAMQAGLAGEAVNIVGSPTTAPASTPTATAAASNWWTQVLAGSQATPGRTKWATWKTQVIDNFTPSATVFSTWADQIDWYFATDSSGTLEAAGETGAGHGHTAGAYVSAITSKLQSLWAFRQWLQAAQVRYWAGVVAKVAVSIYVIWYIFTHMAALVKG